MHYARRVSLRPALIAIALALAMASPASAAEVSLTVEPDAGVRLGSATTISGRVTEAGVPLADRTVSLEVRRHPFNRAWKRRASATTADDGRYTFAPMLNRNHRVRVRLEPAPPTRPYELPKPESLSRRRTAYVLPAFTLAFDQRGARMLRLRQTYTVPRDVELTAPTRFYVGPCRPGRRGRCKARRARLRATAETKRVRAGRYRAKATVRIPRTFRGRFQYVSCFLYSPGSGMGNPDQRCPKRYARLR
jgi:hypothetical protein